jgi:Family of unknown function (DUF5683)
VININSLKYILKFKQAFLLSLFSFFIAKAQNADTASIKLNSSDSSKTIIVATKDTTMHKNNLTKKQRSPKKAALLSAILPGLGQAYNRKYWKIPIIYAGLGGLGYLFASNNDSYNSYRNELIFRMNNNMQVNDYPQLAERDLLIQKEVFRKYRDLSALGFLLVYASNIIEANVDAHLMTYDISDDLSLKWQPHFYDARQRQQLLGVSLTLNLK